MNTQRNQEIEERLAELSMIVDSYHPENEYYTTAILLALNIICVVVIAAIGVFWGIVILGVGLLPIIYKALTSGKKSPSKKELAESACILMSACVSLYKNPESEVHILVYNSYFGGNNLSLYEEFIAIYPQMASKKLKKLASLDLSR